jgi:sugar phosphate isomerase/epimerase
MKNGVLAIQTVLPEGFRDNRRFHEELTGLRESGYGGVELNIAHPGLDSIDSILSFLEEYELMMTNFASGLTAKTYGLSLSHKDEEERQRAVAKVREIMRFLEGSSIGIILGFFKGPAAENRGVARLQFSRSMDDLFPEAEERQVPLIVEATNRYESSVANTLEEAYELVREYNSPYARILPDTFHMNIEEADMLGALSEYLSFYDTVHLSDNNRFFPGFGAVDFGAVLDHLGRIGYGGNCAIEGQTRESFAADSAAAARFLSPLRQ